MSKGGIIALGIGGVLVVAGIMLVSWGVGISNQEVTLRTTIEVKISDNRSEFDNTWKTISQSGQIADKYKDALKEVMVGYADARSSGKEGNGSFINAVSEAIPGVPASVWTDLMNKTAGSRAAWTMRQKELLDLSREHTLLLRRFPSSVLLSMLGRKEIDIGNNLITSAKTKETFRTGEENIKDKSDL